MFFYAHKCFIQYGLYSYVVIRKERIIDFEVVLFRCFMNHCFKDFIGSCFNLIFIFFVQSCRTVH